jgi:thiamine pyrophosphokinase
MPAEEAVEATIVTVIAGGELVLPPNLDPGTFVIAADSGYDHALAHAIEADLLVGDMDSVSPEGLVHAEARGIPIIRHRVDKDETDLELALGEAIDRGATRVDIHGAEGGTIAHLLGVALGLTSLRWADVEVTWHTATGRVSVVRPDHPVSVHRSEAHRFSVVPVGDLRGVDVTGTRWELEDEDLATGSTRGISNEITHDTAIVSVRGGVGLVIIEGA